MLSKRISSKVIIALSLAIFMAWAGHTSALFMGSSQPTWSGNSSVQPHAHDDFASVCAACADHYHSSQTADHAHETPHLTALLSIASKPEQATPVEALRYSISPSPIFLIERPPRAMYVL
jgi:hypothetical protein